MLAGAGDVNGDGFADVLVGAPLIDAPSTDEGRAYLYFGSGAGLDGASQTLGVNEVGIGFALGNAGDVNGDGYDDLIAGAPNAANGEKVRIFHGAAGGLGATPARTLFSPSPSADINFGYGVGGGSDIDGDGYSEVFVVSNAWSNGQTGEGLVLAYAGGPGGVATSPFWTWEPDLAGAALWGTEGAGDLDGDGRGDLAISGRSINGAVGDWVFLSTDGTFPSAPSAVYAPTAPEADQPGSVRVLGDVNCDGLDDLGVAWYGANVAGVDAGIALIHAGAPGGPSPAPVWSGAGSAPYTYFGTTLAGGDVNGDGCGDWWVGRSGLVGQVYLGNPALSPGSPLPTPNNSYLEYGTTEGNWNGDRWFDLAYSISNGYPAQPGNVSSILGSSGGPTSSVSLSSGSNGDRHWVPPSRSSWAGTAGSPAWTAPTATRPSAPVQRRSATGWTPTAIPRPTSPGPTTRTATGSAAATGTAALGIPGSIPGRPRDATV